MLLGLTFAALMAGCSAPTAGVAPGAVSAPGAKPFPGVYTQRGSQPDGFLYRLEVHPDGKWALANMSTGFWGTWSQKEGKVSLSITDGSSGQLQSPREMPVVYDGADSVRLGEEWGQTPFQRLPPGSQYLMSFADTSLAGR